MILWLHLRDACWCPWEPSERFSYIGDVGLGGDGGFGTFFMPWPGLRLVQGFRKGFRKGLHAERQEMGQAPHLHCGLQFGAPVYLLLCDSSLGHPEYFRSREGDSSSWLTNRNAEIRRETRSGSLWNPGEPFHRARRDPIAPDPENRCDPSQSPPRPWWRGKNCPLCPQTCHSTWPPPPQTEGWDRDRTIPMPPRYVPAGKTFAICQGNGNIHTPVAFLLRRRPFLSIRQIC